MWSSLWSGCVQELEPSLVKVEVDLQSGLPSFQIVGLPDVSVRESRERVRSALKNAGFSFPMKRITVNLAPAHVKKEGSSFELAIALVLLMAGEAWESNIFQDTLFLGELSLKGELHEIRGVLPLALGARRKKFKRVLVPLGNVKEASMACSASDIAVYGIKDLTEAVQFLKKEINLLPAPFEKPLIQKISHIDFAEVQGQRWAKRALEIAAAGGHHLLMIGPPGCGKSMLAERLPTILPSLAFEESLEVTQVYSVGGLLKSDMSLIIERPFRRPHHTVSYSGLIGGGVKQVMPGEVSLAHKGVLFLDEIAEFRKDVLEVLREPLEQRKISISRARGKVIYPADFMLVAAMNPCPCGYYKDGSKICTCSENRIHLYQHKISGPLLDRIDIHLYLSRVPVKQTAEVRESSEKILDRVLKAREIQKCRYEKRVFKLNAQMMTKDLDTYCAIDDKSKLFLDDVSIKLGLSLRSYHRILKLSRTIADLSSAEKIEMSHLAEAIQLRMLDQKNQ